MSDKYANKNIQHQTVSRISFDDRLAQQNSETEIGGKKVTVSEKPKTFIHCSLNQVCWSLYTGCCCYSKPRM